MTDTGFTALTSGRLVLRRFRRADLDTFAAYRSDPEIARYQSWEVPCRPGQARRLLAELEATHPDTPGEWFQFAMAVRATDRLIGLIGDCAVHLVERDKHRVSATCDDRNLRSAAVLERAGRRREGHLHVRRPAP